MFMMTVPVLLPLGTLSFAHAVLFTAFSCSCFRLRSPASCFMSASAAASLPAWHATTLAALAALSGVPTLKPGTAGIKARWSRFAGPGWAARSAELTVHCSASA